MLVICIIFPFPTIFSKALRTLRKNKNYLVQSLPNNKYVHWSKLKALADDKSKVAEKMEFVLGRVENIVGKEEKCWLPAFFSFCNNVFKRLESLKTMLITEKMLVICIIFPFSNNVFKSPMGSEKRKQDCLVEKT